MISEESLYAYCSEDVSKIENYEQAVKDNTQTWHCHHRAEILPCGTYSRGDLIKHRLYYQRPAAELILLTRSEHHKLHRQANKVKRNGPYSEISRKRMSLSRKGKPTWNKGKKGIYSKETCERMSSAASTRVGEKNGFFGKSHNCETKSKISTTKSRQRWFTNNVVETMATECPGEGWARGRLSR